MITYNICMRAFYKNEKKSLYIKYSLISKYKTIFTAFVYIKEYNVDL